MLTRWQFIKAALFGTGTLAVADLSALAGETQRDPKAYAPQILDPWDDDWGRPRFTYKDWDVRWTGWKGSANSDLLVGQWVAWRKGDELGYVVNVPNLWTARYPRYATFNVGATEKRSKGELIKVTQTRAGRRQALKEGRDILIDMLDGKIHPENPLNLWTDGKAAPEKTL